MNEYSKDLMNNIKKKLENILYDFLNKKKKKKRYWSFFDICGALL